MLVVQSWAFRVAALGQPEVLAMRFRTFLTRAVRSEPGCPRLLGWARVQVCGWGGVLAAPVVSSSGRLRGPRVSRPSSVGLSGANQSWAFSFHGFLP